MRILNVWCAITSGSCKPLFREIAHQHDIRDMAAQYHGWHDIERGFAYPEPQIVTTLEIDEPDPELTKMQLQLSRK